MDLDKLRVINVILISIFVVLLLALIITPTVFYRAQWSYSNIIGAEIIQDNGFISIPSSTDHPYLYTVFGKLLNQLEASPGIQLLLAQISLLTGQDILSLYSFFPLGQVLFIAAAILLAKVFFPKDKKKQFFLILLSAIGAFGPSMMRIDFHVLQTSIMVFSFAATLWAVNKNIKEKTLKYVLLVLALLLLNRLVYFSTSIFFYIFLVSFSFLLFLSSYIIGERNLTGNIRNQSLLYILFSFIFLFSWASLSLFGTLLNNVTLLTFLSMVGIIVVLLFFIFLKNHSKKKLRKFVSNLSDSIIDNLPLFALILILLSPIIFFFILFKFELVGMSLRYRIVSLLMILPSFLIIPFMLKEYFTDNKITNLIYLSAIFSFFALLPFSLYMTYLVTRSFVLFQLLFFVGLVIFISMKRFEKSKLTNYLFLFIVIILLLNNFTYLMSNDNNYGSSNDIRVREGLTTFLEGINPDEKISSDLKILSNALVLGHETSYLPYNSDPEESRTLLKSVFYSDNDNIIYNTLSNAKVDYFILSEEMFEYGIYSHDYQEKPLSDWTRIELDSSKKFNKVYSNGGLWIYQLI